MPRATVTSAGENAVKQGGSSLFGARKFPLWGSHPPGAGPPALASSQLRNHRGFVAVTPPAPAEPPHSAVPSPSQPRPGPENRNNPSRGSLGREKRGSPGTHRVPEGSRGSGYPGSYRIPAGIRCILPLVPPARSAPRAEETRGAGQEEEEEEGKEEEEKKKKSSRNPTPLTIDRHGRGAAQDSAPSRGTNPRAGQSRAPGDFLGGFWGFLGGLGGR